MTTTLVNEKFNSEKSNIEKYKNPENTEEILEKLKNVKFGYELFQLIQMTFPTLILNFIKEYSLNYDFLNTIWKERCEKDNVTMKQICIFDTLGEDSSYSVSHRFYEYIKNSGFDIKFKTDIIQCTKCKKALPTSSYYKVLSNTL